MLWAISYNSWWHCDIDMFLSEFELWKISVRQKVSWLLLLQGPHGRDSKKIEFWSESSVKEFSFSQEADDVFRVWVSQKIREELMQEKRIFTRCDSFGLDGTKIDIRTLESLDGKYLEGSLLSTAWIYLARKTKQSQDKEQDLVEGLFSNISALEHDIIYDILHP